MQDNPYQYSGSGRSAQSVAGRPFWIYAATLAAAGFTTSLPFLVIALLVWPRFGVDSLTDRQLGASLLAASLGLSLVVGWRTWVRLNRVHDRLVSLNRTRDEFLRQREETRMQ